MKTLRQVHLYLGCAFAPLLIYFALSGAWQVFRFNDVPREGPGSPVRSFFHELSKPHTNSTLPGSSPKTEHSTAFSVFALTMSLGIIATAAIGIALAWRYARSPRLVLLCLMGGVVLPLGLLWLH